MNSNFYKFPIALTIIVLVATAGLTRVYMNTKGIIEQQKQQKVSSALKRVLKEAETFEIKRIESPQDSFWIGKNKDGNIQGLAFIGTYRGYSSLIECMVGIDTTGIIKNISVLSEAETPGLGMRMEEIASKATIWNPHSGGNKKEAPWFQTQYCGLDTKKEIKIVKGVEWCQMNIAQKNKLKQNNSVSALTGATISTNALTKAITVKAKVILKAFTDSKLKD